MKSTEFWILGFDGSCEACWETSQLVASASGGRLEVKSLSHPDMIGWREQALGAEPPWTPTLIKVDGDHVTAWTGPRMGLALAGRLGPAATIRVLAALGQLRDRARHPERRPRPTGEFGRAQFLRLGAGAAVAAGLVLTGQTPAFAKTGAAEAKAWVAANRTQLPQTYAAIADFPRAYRREIFGASTTKVRAALWTEQLRTYAADHAAELTVDQRAAIDRGLVLAADPSTFDYERVRGGAARSELDDLTAQSVAAFGERDAKRVFADLGGPSESPQQDPFCPCSTESDYCGGSTRCVAITCNAAGIPCECFSLCGTFYAYECNGYCR